MNEKKEYIDRGLYCETICRCNGAACDKSKCPIWNAPAADVAPVVHGHWVNIVDYGGGDCVGYCSVCKAEHTASNSTALRFAFAYCRWCGAKMDGGSSESY